MNPLSTVLLKPGEADRVLAGHPWIYHGSIIRLTQPANDGDIVQVKDHRQRLLGVGFYNSKSKINVRMIAPERVEVNQLKEKVDDLVDLALVVPSRSAARIQEVHITIGHALCEVVDRAFARPGTTSGATGRRP